MQEAAGTLNGTADGLVAAGETGEAMEAPRKRAPASNFLPIVNGRLPLIFVHNIRFNETKSNSELAKLYATSVGKVFDIKKGRNFAYVTQDFKPTQADIDAANDWISKIGAENTKHGVNVDTGDKAHLDGVVAAYHERGLASAEEAAAFAATRTTARAPRKTKEAAPAGQEGDSAAPSADAADLLS